MNDKPRISLSKHFKAAAMGVATVGAPALAQAASIGPVHFDASPWMLMAIPATAALWWLMKSVPRKPVQQIVPHIRLLYKLASQEQTPKRVPWWQYAAVATAVAGTTAALTSPTYNPEAPLSGDGPVMLVVDNDWAGARDWKARQEQMQHVIDRADKANRPVIIVPTAAPQDGTDTRVQGPMPASEARAIARDMSPHSWPVNYEAALHALQQAPKQPAGSVIWLSNGLDDKNLSALTQTLQQFGTLSVYEDNKTRTPYLLGEPDALQADLSIPVRRAHTDKEEKLTLIAQDDKGLFQGYAEVTFKAGEDKILAAFKIPKEARNAVTRVIIAQNDTAGGNLLVDERFRRRAVGIIENSHANAADPLTDENHYLTQAMAPFADLKTGAVDKLLQNKLSVLVMADSATVTQAQRAQIDKWVQEEGGTLIRFAGPRLAQEISDGAPDNLLPQTLSQTRQLGNQTTGAAPGKLKPFAGQSPFKDIASADDVQVTQQILPRAGHSSDVQVWAQLQDNTPLVSARASGKGQIILVHTTADPRWSNLAHSGTYVDMLQAAVRSSQAVGMTPGNNDMALPPVRMMDATGHMTTPAPAVRPLTAEAIEKGQIGPRHPPGIYGQNKAYYAHNLYVAVPELKPLGDLPADVSRRTYATGKKDSDLTGWAWLIALSALLAETGMIAAQSRGQKRKVRATPKAEISA